jgi:hypothetical protein
MRMVANVMRATLSALILFSREEVLFAIKDVNIAWKSALCFKIAASKSPVAAAIASSAAVGFVTLGEGGRDAMVAKVLISLTTGLLLSESFLMLRTSRIDCEVAAWELGPDMGQDLVAERERDLERVRAALALVASSLSLGMLLEQKISE